MEHTKPDHDSRIYVGAVSHRRLKPVSHRFTYQIFSLLIDIDELPELDRDLRWFAHNRFALLSFMDKDHGPKDGSPLRPWIEARLAEGGLDFTPGAIRVLCFPRLFGFVFNPLSIWYCHDTDGVLRAILYEVRNTFGQWRGYLLPVDEARKPGEPVRQACDKAFYVSPLMEMDCRYHFTLTEPGEKVLIGIRETRRNGQGEDERTLLAVQTGTARRISDASLLKTFLAHPLMFFKIVAAIHWEAIRTLIKGAPFRANPQTTNGDVVYPARPAKGSSE